MARDEAGTLSRLKALRADVIDPKMAQFDGRLVGTAGDSLLVEFASAVDAVQCAVEVQERIFSLGSQVPDEKRMTFRMGINLGDVIPDEGTIYGDGVNVAARLEKISEPGGVVIARNVYEQVKAKLPYDFVDLGQQAMKNIAEPVHTYAIAMAGQPPPSLPQGDKLPLPSKPSVAVLPFNNMSGGDEQEYFSDGITEDIITDLSRSPSLFVIARNSSFVFKGKAVDVTEVGRKLGVRYVVEGSVRRAGNRLRITAQLIEAETGSHVWAERYDRDLEDLFAVQDEVTERIVWSLAGKVAAAEIARARRPGKRLDAYDALLRGIDAMNRFTDMDAEGAIEHFKLSIALDPESIRAHAWLAEAYANVAGFGGHPSMQGLACQTARRAIDMGDGSGHAEAVVAAHCAWNREFELADAHLRKALLLGPANPEVLAWTGFVSLWQGHHAKAIEIGEKIRRLDPLDPRYAHELLAFAYYLLGDYSASLESFRRWNNENYLRGFANLSACLGQLGRREEARAAWEKCLSIRADYTMEEYQEGFALSPAGGSGPLDGWLGQGRGWNVTRQGRVAPARPWTYSLVRVLETGRRPSA